MGILGIVLLIAVVWFALTAILATVIGRAVHAADVVEVETDSTLYVSEAAPEVPSPRVRLTTTQAY
jgi:hypothetical protein